MEKTIRQAALENAIKFKGKANPGAVIGAVIQAHPEAKKDMKATSQKINAIIKEVNALSLEEQEKELLAINPSYHEEQQAAREERKAARSELPELPGAVMQEVETRMPPEPSKYNHLGHAMSFLINFLYAKKYEGRCILRFDDTNPEKESQEFVDAMLHDIIEYLGLEPDEIIYVSDHMPRFYDAANDLIERDLAYTCDCLSEDISKQRREMRECPHRNKSKEETKQEWEFMQKGELNTSTLRLKIDMAHKNAVMRDPVIMRVCTTPHYRQGEDYKVWPMYDFESALADSWFGTTHVLRSNEFDTRIELHNHIKELFKLPKQVCVHYGRYAVEGMTTQGREIRAKIESGEMIGWDDPKLLTLRALRRRGIVPEAYVDLAKQIGLSKTQTNLDFGVIAAINRRILDEEANRYFFVEDPVKITVQDWPEHLTQVELKLHPHKNRGGRILKLNGEFFIAKKDFEIIKDGKMFRLIDTINLQYDGQSCKVHSESIDEYKRVPKNEKHGLIHFLPTQDLIDARIFMPEGKYRTGVCEPAISQIREGAHVQFERVCFARLDVIEEIGSKKMLTFWYTHE